MHVLRRSVLTVSFAICAGCVLLLRDLVFRDAAPFPGLEARLAHRLAPLAARMQFTHVLPFALLVLLALAVAALTLSWRGLRLPSPARDVRLAGPGHPFLSGGASGRAALAIFAATEAVLVVLVRRDSIPPAWLWAASLLALAALAVCADRAAAPGRSPRVPASWAGECAAVLGLAVACAALAGYRLNGWEWSGSEDSYGFYGVARDLTSGELRAPLLSPDGVFGLYAVASSWLQAVLFPVLGATGEALRAGNLVLVAALVGLGYAFARPLIGRTGAFATAALLGSSVLVQTYARYGYNNLQGLVFAMLALAFASRAAATGRWLPLVFSGMAAGAGLFSYALAAISGAAVLFWLACSARPSRRSLRAAAVFGVASLAAAAPCLLSRHYMTSHLEKLSVFSPELAENGPGRTPLASRVLHAVAQPALNLDSEHGAAGPRLDPVSVLLLVVGFAALAGGTGARTASLGLIALSLFWPISIGALQPYPYPMSPWVLLATPAWAFLGGCGVVALGRALPFTRATEAVLLLAVPAAAAWSARQVHVESFRVAPLRPLAFTVATAQAVGASGRSAVLVVPVPIDSDDGLTIREAVADADVPSVRVETPAWEDAGLEARLEALREGAAVLVLYETGASFPPRERLRALVRSAWPEAREVRYRSLPSEDSPRSATLFVSEHASAIVPFLPSRNRSEK